MLQTPDVSPSSAWMDAWLGYELHLLSEGRAARTITNLRSLILILAKHATQAGVGPEEVTKTWLLRYFVDQAKERQGAGAVTLHKYLASFWSWYAAEYGTPNPLAGIPRPTGKSAVPPVLSPEQIKAVWKACRTERDTAIVSLLLESGIRRFELVALDLDDIDLKDKKLVVKKGKGSKQRVASFGDRAARDVWRWLKRRPAGSVALFTNSRGQRLTPGALNVALRVIGARAGVELRPHILRHTWCHYVLSGGMSEGDVMRLAGWSSSTMLMRYGASLAEERALAAARVIQVGKMI